MKRFVCGILGICAIAACVCPAAPEPAIVQAPGQWTLDMEFTHPQQITIPRGSDKKPLQYWYTIITLTNNTGNDVDFYPKCDLMTDSFQIIPAGKFVSSMLFNQVKRRHNSKYPFLEPLSSAGTKILQGQDNTKDIAVIWPNFDTQAKSLSLFITGLSNETAAVDHPVLKGDSGEPLKVFLRKTLELQYSLRGDQALRTNSSFAYQSKRWVMR
ncbi:MAG: hypothetical protein ACYSUX_04510 [Planctomycetota bacterium]|jgi:hypothetical protein